MAGLTKAEAQKLGQDVYDSFLGLSSRHRDQSARDQRKGALHSADVNIGAARAFQLAARILRDRLSAHYIVIDEKGEESD